MRLRTRFFLISWPLVVLAIAAVAFGVDRWTVAELQRIEHAQRPARDRSNDAALADSLAAMWARRGPPASPSDLPRPTGFQDGANVLVVLDSVGLLVATSDGTVELVMPPDTPGGVARFVRSGRNDAGDVTESVVAVDGFPVRAPDDRVLGALYVLSVPRPGEDARSLAARSSALRRRIWYIAGAAALAAAAAAVLLAGPLVARVRRIADAAGAVRRGALETRVDEAGGDELAELGASFNAMTAALAEARMQQRKLVGDVAHELRTPLSNLVALVEAMQDGLQPCDDATLGIMRRQAGLLASLVEELQELSLAESGALKLDIGDVDAVALARDAVAAIAPSANGQQIVPPDATHGVLVRADPRRLAQCLGNLLRNALTHTPAGGRVAVHVARSGSVVSLAVEDTGAGIPPEHLPLVFDRFHRVDPSRARSTGGMGLGLAVVRELVTAMGGRVHADSDVGRGSRFVIELPAAHM